MKTKTFILFVAFSFSLKSFAQEVHFENTNQALVSLNPSFAGSNGGIRLQNYYRNQWPNLSARYVTYQTCADVYLKKIKGGLALFAFEDDQAASTLKTQESGLSYSQHFSALGGKLKILPSIQMSYIKLRLDVNGLPFGYGPIGRFGHVWTSRNTVIVANKSNLDFSTGLLCNYKDLFIGLAVKHITQPDIGLLGVSKLPALYRFHASYNKKINDKNLLQFFVMCHVQRKFVQMQLSSNAVLFKHLVLGLSYLSNDVAMINGGYRNNYLTLQLGYNAIVNKLSGTIAGIWNLNFSFNLRNKELRKELTSFETW